MNDRVVRKPTFRIFGSSKMSVFKSPLSLSILGAARQSICEEICVTPAFRTRILPPTG